MSTYSICFRAFCLQTQPENIVLCSRKERKVKLIDFGLSIILQDGVVAREITGTPEFVGKKDVIHSFNSLNSCF